MREVLGFAVLSVWEWITFEGTEKRDFYFTLSERENMPGVKFHSWLFYMQLKQTQSPTRKRPNYILWKEERDKIMTLG